MGEKRYNIMSMSIGALLAVSVFFGGKGTAVNTGSAAIKVGRAIPCVVIDAGHGGNDPGKVGINGALEKDINLEIALILKKFLEAGDIRVELTREGDMGLYDEGASNKKVQDMKRRIDIIDAVAPDLCVSIHQNSFTQERVHGAQVFFFDGSKEGEKLAAAIQNRIVVTVDEGNTREIKPNDSYYLLKKTGVPIVIVECGFLSNRAEADKLSLPLYQEKVAWAIHMGILQYLNSKK
jgi:N-acetylmuramoyl-L-alanine amidase